MNGEAVLPVEALATVVAHEAGVVVVLPQMALTCRDEDPVLAKKPDPGLCTSNEGRVL